MDAICGVYCAGTPTTTSTATTKLQHKMEMNALNDSEAGNGGGKACKFLLVHSRHHHHKPPSFMRIGNFDKIDLVVFLAYGIPIPATRSHVQISSWTLENSFRCSGPWFRKRRFRRNPPTRSTRFFCLERFVAERFGSEKHSRVSNEICFFSRMKSCNRNCETYRYRGNVDFS